MRTETDLAARVAEFFGAVDGKLSREDFCETTEECVVPRSSDKIRCSDQRGLYYYLNDSREVLYVGRAAFVPLGARYWSHAQKVWADGAIFRAMPLTDAADHDTTFLKRSLLCALETYLIAHLEPPQNRKLG